MWSFNYLTVLCFIGVASAANLPPACKITDIPCLTKIAKMMFDKAVRGVPELGIQSADPLYTDVITADVPNLKFQITDSTVVGFKECDVREVSINKKSPEESTMNMNLFCPHFAMTGKYSMDGKLGELPIQGYGGFDADATEYQLDVVADLKSMYRNGQKYAYIENTKISTELLGKLKFDMKNLFNGDEAKAAPIKKFIADNPKLTGKLLDGPVFDKNFGKLIEAFNKLLQETPVEMVIDNN